MSSPNDEPSCSQVTKQDVYNKRMRTDSRNYSADRNRIKKTRVEGHSRSFSKISKANAVSTPPACLIDNGGYTIKVGLSSAEKPKIIPNCITKAKSEKKRMFIADEIEECRDLSGLYYLLPCQKGYITKWEVQKPVWDHVFTKHSIPVKGNDVIMTQPIYNFKAIQECIDEIFFEEYECSAMYRASATDFARHEYLKNVTGKQTSCIIVDSGYSFTHIVPYINAKKFYKGVKRINIGGKFLTNYLKDIISYRQLYVMDETFVINQVKEDVCYVSQTFNEDIRTTGSSGTNNSIVKNYVLPDFNNIRRGYSQDPHEASENLEGLQILHLNNERVTVPELLFHPSDIGIKSMGIAEAIVKSILCCPLSQQPILANNIVLIGGNVNFPGFQERVESDVRSRLSDHWRVNVYKPNDPITFPWQGQKTIVQDPDLKSMLVSKLDYEENGSSYTRNSFSDWLWPTEVELEPEPVQTEEEPVRYNFLDEFTNSSIFGKYDEPEETVVEEPAEKTPPTIETDNLEKQSESDDSINTITDDNDASTLQYVVESPPKPQNITENIVPITISKPQQKIDPAMQRIFLCNLNNATGTSGVYKIMTGASIGNRNEELKNPMIPDLDGFLNFEPEACTWFPSGSSSVTSPATTSTIQIINSLDCNRLTTPSIETGDKNKIKRYNKVPKKKKPLISANIIISNSCEKN